MDKWFDMTRRLNLTPNLRYKRTIKILVTNTGLTSFKQTKNNNMYITFIRMNPTRKCWWCQNSVVESTMPDHDRNFWGPGK